MSEVCNSCGAPNDVHSCIHCSTLLCTHCRVNHESICVENQKKIRRREGPTVLPTQTIAALATLALPDLGVYRDELQVVEDACKSTDKGSPTHSHDEACFAEPARVEDAQRESEVCVASEAYDHDDSPYNPERDYENFEHGGEA